MESMGKQKKKKKKKNSHDDNIQGDQKLYTWAW